MGLYIVEKDVCANCYEEVGRDNMMKVHGQEQGSYAWVCADVDACDARIDSYEELL